MQASAVESEQKINRERIRQTGKSGKAPRPRFHCASRIWLHDLAALVQMAKFVKESLLGVEINGRCMRICTWK